MAACKIHFVKLRLRFAHAHKFLLSISKSADYNNIEQLIGERESHTSPRTRQAFNDPGESHTLVSI